MFGLLILSEFLYTSLQIFLILKTVPLQAGVT